MEFVRLSYECEIYDGKLFPACGRKVAATSEAVVLRFELRVELGEFVIF